MRFAGKSGRNGKAIMSEEDIAGSGESTIKIFEAENMLEAGMVEQMLGSQGIDSILQSNVTPGIFPIESGPLGGVGPIAIYVLESDKARAEELIRQMLDERRQLDNGDQVAEDEDGGPDPDADESADGKDLS